MRPCTGRLLALTGDYALPFTNHPSRWDIVRGEPSRPAPENTKSPDEKSHPREWLCCLLSALVPLSGIPAPAFNTMAGLRAERVQYNACIFRGVRVPTSARLRLVTMMRSAQHVLFGRYRFEVGRIDTQGNPAKMVNVLAVR